MHKKLLSLLLVFFIAMSLLCPISANAETDSLSLRYLSLTANNTTFNLKPTANAQVVFLSDGIQSVEISASVETEGSEYWFENTTFSQNQTELEVRVTVKDMEQQTRVYRIYVMRPLPSTIPAEYIQEQSFDEEVGNQLPPEVTDEREIPNPAGDEPFDPYYADSTHEQLFSPHAAGQAGTTADVTGEELSEELTEDTVDVIGETGSILENATLRQPDKSKFNILGIIVLILLGIGLISVSFVLIYSVIKPNKSVFSHSSYVYSSPKNKSPMFPSRSNFYKFGRRYIR